MWRDTSSPRETHLQVCILVYVHLLIQPRNRINYLVCCCLSLRGCRSLDRCSSLQCSSRVCGWRTRLAWRTRYALNNSSTSTQSLDVCQHSKHRRNQGGAVCVCDNTRKAGVGVAGCASRDPGYTHSSRKLGNSYNACLDTALAALLLIRRHCEGRRRIVARG